MPSPSFGIALKGQRHISPGRRSALPWAVVFMPLRGEDIGIIKPALPHVPSAMQWNLTLDQQLLRGTTLRLAYFGTHGYHLDSGYTVNTNSYIVQPDGSIFYPPGIHLIRPDYAVLNGVFYDFNFYYNAFEATLRRQVSRGLALQVSYAFSRATDDTSYQNLLRSLMTAELRPPNGLRNTYHGLSAFDMRHRFVANFTYDFPSVAASSGLVTKLFSGWQMNSIITWQAGTPLTPWVGFDRANSGAQNAGETQRPSRNPSFTGSVVCLCQVPASLGGGVQKLVLFGSGYAGLGTWATQAR